MRQIVIIGNGIAGITAAREIRKRSNDPITVISSETEHFYSRTALMYIYMGHLQYHHTKPYEDWFWAKSQINLLYKHVEHIDFEHKTIQWEQGEMLYDVLILALGSKPNLFDWPGQHLRGVQGLYGIPDLERMEQNTQGIRQAVVVGGGLIGIEMVEMLLSRQIQVTFLVREASFWRTVLPAEESALITQHIREHGVDLRLQTELDAILGDNDGRVRAAQTLAGEEIQTQFVGITVGVSPNIHFLQNSQLNTDRGILVNEYLETNLPDVYAIGDCVQHIIPPPGRKAVEQIWYTGRIMGETVAQTITGQRTAYRPGIFFNSAKFFDIEYQTYGIVPADLPSDGSLRTFYWAHPDNQKAIRINFQGGDKGIVTGMNTFGIRQRQEVWARWIQEKRDIRYVMTHLSEANFDPEFFRRYEPQIQLAFNAEWPALAILAPKPKKWLTTFFAL